MYVIVGLGNPGRKYQHTRHNVGFDVTEVLSQKYDIPMQRLRCKAVVGVLAGRETRIARIMARDEISREAAETRIDAQKPNSYYETNCTHLLHNHADIAEFEADCRELFKEITEKWMI